MRARLERLLESRRAVAEELMVDTCRIDRGGGLATDPDTGAVTPSYTAAYTGKCKVQAAGGVSSVSTPDAGEHSWAVQQLQVHVPVSAGPFFPDDIVTMLASAHSPHLVGRSFRVPGLAAKWWATAQRLIVEEVVG